MKVKELIEQLSRFDPELEVFKQPGDGLQELSDPCIGHRDTETDYYSVSEDIEEAMDEFMDDMEITNISEAVKRLKPFLLLE